MARIASGAAVQRHRRRFLQSLCLAALCAALAAAAAVTAFTVGGVQVAARGRTWQSRTGSPVARSAEAFDPFGWKGQFKDTVQGLLDGIGDDEEPTKLEEQMILEIFGKFDKDKDGILNLEEFNTLQVATEGNDATYNQDQLVELLLAVNPDLEEPDRGMPFADYRRLYVEGRLRRAYSTDVSRDHVKIFGPGGGVAAAAVAAKTSETSEVPAEGTAVVIEGLSGAKELNGSEGHIVAPIEDEAEMVAEGRVIVRLADGERLALRPANVKAA